MPIDPDELERAAIQAEANLQRDAEKRRRREKRKQQKVQQEQASQGHSQHNRHNNDTRGAPPPRSRNESPEASGPQTSRSWLVLNTCFNVFKYMMFYPVRSVCRIVGFITGNKWMLVPTTTVVCIWIAAVLLEGVFVSVVESLVTLHLGWLLSAVGIQVPTAQTADGPAAVPYSTARGQGTDLAVRDSGFLGQVRDMSSNIQYLSQIQVYSQLMSPVARFVSDSFKKFLVSKKQPGFGTVDTADDLGEEWSRFWSGIDMQVSALLEQSDQYTKHILKNQVDQYRHAQLLLQRIQVSSVLSGGRDDGCSWARPRSWITCAYSHVWGLLERSWKLVAGQVWVPTEQEALTEHTRTLARLVKKSKASHVYLASVFADSDDSKAQPALDSTLCEVECVFREAVHACDWTTNYLQINGARDSDVDVDMTTTYGENSLAGMHLTGYQSAGAVLCVGAKETVESKAMRSEAARKWEQTLDGLDENVGLMLTRLERQSMNNAEMEGIERELVHHVNQYVQALETFAS